MLRKDESNENSWGYIVSFYVSLIFHISIFSLTKYRNNYIIVITDYIFLSYLINVGNTLYRCEKMAHKVL